MCLVGFLVVRFLCVLGFSSFKHHDMEAEHIHTHQTTAHFHSKQGLQSQCPNTCHSGQATGCCRILPPDKVFYEKPITHSDEERVF